MEPTIQWLAHQVLTEVTVSENTKPEARKEDIMRAEGFALARLETSVSLSVLGVTTKTKTCTI